MVSSGIFIATDPDQEKNGLYKVGTTINITTTLLQLNMARAYKDFHTIKFIPVSDLKKSNEFLKPALKKKYVSNSTDWIKVEGEENLTKLILTIETLAAIVNNE